MAGQAEPLHVAGVSIPGLPLIVVGHNEHVAWGFTNLGADVQDVYIESLRGSGNTQEFEAVDGSWQPVIHLQEHIAVSHGVDQQLDVVATRHGDTVTPLLDPVLTKADRSLSLRWTLYDPTVLQLPVLAIAQAHDWPSFLQAFSGFGGPAQNVVYADDQGHIGYHAVGRVPLRGPAVRVAAQDIPDDLASPITPRSSTESPVIRKVPGALAGSGIQAPAAPVAAQLSGPLSPVPLVPSAAHEWSGYIPFDQLPQIYDPPGGVIATANARIVPDDYAYPVTLNWAAPYRNERIWHVLAHRTGLKVEDMPAIQIDIYSDLDHVLAQRLSYALDHSGTVTTKHGAGSQKTLHQAADLLRTWNGRVTTDSSAAYIVNAVKAVLWPMLLESHLQPAASGARTPPLEINAMYVWGERDYALEQILMHQPPRWLPAGYSSWDDFLTAAVTRALVESRAPSDLAGWHYGSTHTLDIEAPIFAQSALLRKFVGARTGTGEQPQSGDGTTVKQVGHTFGPSERFTADLSDLDHSTLNVVLGQSGNPLSPYYMDQFQAWLHGNTYALPFTDAAVNKAATHTLTLVPGR